DRMSHAITDYALAAFMLAALLCLYRILRAHPRRWSRVRIGYAVLFAGALLLCSGLALLRQPLDTVRAPSRMGTGRPSLVEYPGYVTHNASGNTPCPDLDL